MLQIISSRELNELNNEVEELREETLRLMQERNTFELKLHRLYGVELEEKLTNELGLTSYQRAKLRLLCSVELARLVGVPEDKILHDLDEITEFFTVGES